MNIQLTCKESWDTWEKLVPFCVFSGEISEARERAQQYADRMCMEIRLNEVGSSQGEYFRPNGKTDFQSKINKRISVLNSRLIGFMSGDRLAEVSIARDKEELTFLNNLFNNNCSADRK